MLTSRILAMLLLAPTSLLATSFPAELVGTWVVDENSVKNLGMPPSCNASRVRYEENGETIQESGALTYKAKSTVQARSGGFEITTQPYENNGRPNCQGRSAEFFFSHYQATSYVEIVGNRMLFYILGKEDGRFLAFRRE